MSPLPAGPALAPDEDARHRTTHLSEVLRTLYPGTEETGGTPTRAYLALPDTRRPRLLVPAGNPVARRAAAAAVRDGTTARSRWRRLLRATAATALRTGAAGLLRPGRIRVRPDGSVEQHLAEMLDQQLLLALHIGPARANRKPVAQLLDPVGQVNGFLKVGTGDLTRRLVRTETAALAALSHLPLRHLTVPEVRYAGPWRDHQLLVQSALPVRRCRPAPCPHRLTRAMREVALSCGVTRCTLASSRYAQRLAAGAGTVATRPEGGVLAAAVTSLLARAADLELAFGTWHGDWAPWNMAALPETLLVWDWERFLVGVPLGFDALHYDLQRRLQSTADAAEAVRATLATVDELLIPFGVPAPARRPTALLYLADLALRYLTDRQAEAGGRLGVLGNWLLPVLTHQLEDLR